MAENHLVLEMFSFSVRCYDLADVFLILNSRYTAQNPSFEIHQSGTPVCSPEELTLSRSIRTDRREIEMKLSLCQCLVRPQEDIDANPKGVDDSFSE